MYTYDVYGDTWSENKWNTKIYMLVYLVVFTTTTVYIISVLLQPLQFIL